MMRAGRHAVEASAKIASVVLSISVGPLGLFPRGCAS